MIPIYIFCRMCIIEKEEQMIETRDLPVYKTYTIHDIAQKAGVSIATVSRVLNGSGPVKESTKQKIISAMNELEKKGAPPASLRKNSKILLASFPELTNPFYANIFKGISDTASMYDYKVVFYQFEKYASAEAYSFFTEVPFYQGLIVAHAVPDYTILEDLSKKIPIVMCSEHSEASFVPYVAIDDKEAAYNAVRYLIRTGRKKLGLINSSFRNNYAVHRERAFRKCLSDHKLEINENWIVHLTEINYDLSLTAASNILAMANHPDAFFCVSDVYAAAVINTAKSVGMTVPDDIAVVGFDNIDIANMTIPPITTVAQPTYQLGAQACKLLIEQIEFPSISQKHIVLNTELILRGST